MIYLDTSALLKTVFVDEHSPALKDYIRGMDADGFVSSVLLTVELRRAVRRIDPRLLPKADVELVRVSQVELSAAVVERASRFPDPGLRSLDAIHVATALLVRDELTAVCPRTTSGWSPSRTRRGCPWSPPDARDAPDRTGHLRVGDGRGRGGEGSGRGGGFGEAVHRECPLWIASKVAVVLGWAVRSLLEELHPDGMDGEDVRAVLTGCTTAAGAWESEVDPSVLLVALTGALGMSDPDEQPALPPEPVARNATLLLAFLLGERPLARYLDAAFAELRRAETIEMP